MARDEQSGRNARTKRTALLVAHPDDEVLWAGGTILLNPAWAPTVAVLCRASDPDRAPKFFEVVKRLGATGAMADLDDGPEQHPLAEDVVAETALSILPDGGLDLLITHSPVGEYTRHRRHEECCRAVVELWQASLLSIGRLCFFAYEDGGGAYAPRARADADLRYRLSPSTLRRKRDIITRLYGFSAQSWEARITPHVEGFHCLRSPDEAARRVAACEVMT